VSRRIALLVACAAGALLLAACGTVSVAVATQHWASANSFLQASWDLDHDARQVHTAIARHRSPSAIRTACLELFQDANGVNTDLLPTPDAQLTTLLSSTVDAYVHAAAVCDEESTSASALVAVDHQLVVAHGDLIATLLREFAVSNHPVRILGIP